MLSKRLSDDAQDDERRLFPNYDKNSPDAVRITPGQTFNKSSKITNGYSPYRPIDTITRNSRQSGPVRASGKGRQLDDRSVAIPGFAHHGYFLETDEGNRPTKRQRRNPETPSGPVVDLIDDEDMEHPTSPTATSTSFQRTSRLSSTSSQQSIRPKKSKGSGNKLDEYRNVERLMSMGHSLSSPQRVFHRKPVVIEDDNDVQPTPKKKQGDMQEDAEGPEADEASRDHKPEVLDSVEICNTRNEKDVSELQSPKSRKKLLSTDGKRRISTGRESPDELQGAITVQRAPPSLDGVHVRDGSVSSSADRSKTDTHRRSSPSDIRPTEFTSASSKKQGKAKRNGRDKRSHMQLFEADLFHFGPVSLEGQKFEFIIDKTQGILSLTAGKDSDKRVDIPLRKITTVLEGESPSRKVRLRLSKVQGSGEVVDIQLGSEEEKDGFCKILKRGDSKFISKEGEWMDHAFDKNKKTIAAQKSRHKRPNTENTEEPIPQPNHEKAKRPKLCESLQADSANSSGLSGPMISRPPRRLGEASSHEQTQTEVADPDSHSHPSRHGSDEGIPIPVKKYTDNPLYKRETRSKSRKALPTVISDDKEPAVEKAISDHKPRKWAKPLVYPRVGKKKAEVDVHDLERLRDGEFLNDNLVGFYLRFLEHHLERTSPETAKKIYFFNSYFFETLTNLPRGKRGINYEGVQKWTRNVDIFSHDYIIVPINESAHWYVAIICNLPRLQGPQEDSPEFEGFPDDEVSTRSKTEACSEIPETPPAVAEDGSVNDSKNVSDVYSDSGKEEKTRQSLASMTLSDNGEAPSPTEEKVQSRAAPEADDDWPEGEENPASSPLKFTTPGDYPRESEPSKELESISRKQSQGAEKGKKQKKKPARSLPKYDPKQPVIITFDSLDLPRSPTVRCLREYLYEEGKSKRGIDVDVKAIKGMTAREIPLQPNFSDCGLYLLAYMEKFIQDPDTFVTSLLQRDMKTETDWPSLKSGLLRRRLRKFLDDLYEEQEQSRRQKATEATTMADRRPISYLLGPSQSKADKGGKPVQKSERNDSKDRDLSTDQSGTGDSPPEDSSIRKSNSDSLQGAVSEDTSKQAVSDDTIPEQNTSGRRPEEEAATVPSSVGEVPEDTAATVQPSDTNTMTPANVSSDREVIEVLDSQSQQVLPSPRVSRDKKGKGKSEKRRAEAVDDENFLDELQEVVKTSPKVRVEVQVPGTPPPSRTTLVEDSPRRNARPARSTNKGKDD
ncbi:Ulp1 protease, putative [Paecilomyces variotii No. 5]|uniref:Ulp1 protease, putative n=1 Tax=Byssochlamys spectabilis (strain No. 5 / NBRC 109023) TaxID=1356009 RepID=V5I210_BYSSN|nr:Ulp1 protease, putative [Paecilomyces variotii No. 5]